MKFQFIGKYRCRCKFCWHEAWVDDTGLCQKCDNYFAEETRLLVQPGADHLLPPPKRENEAILRLKFRSAQDEANWLWENYVKPWMLNNGWTEERLAEMRRPRTQKELEKLYPHLKWNYQGDPKHE